MASGSAGEPISEEEAFATLYYYFIMHLRGLAADAETQLSSGHSMCRGKLRSLAMPESGCRVQRGRIEAGDR